MKKEVRKQEALAAIEEFVDRWVMSVTEGGEEMPQWMKCKSTFNSTTYKMLVWGRAGQHFKFLTAEWINKAIDEQIEKSCKEWGLNL